MAYGAELRAAAARAGATLVEVLMSLLVMGIGVVCVATLFPASVLRSIQATQLTNATILRYNAEAAIEVVPTLVHNPDGRADPTTLFGTNYVVDPWGANAIGNTFGTVSRYNGGLGTSGRARDFVCSPDSWTHVATAASAGSTSTSVTLPSTVDLSAVQIDEDTNRDGSIGMGETDSDGDGLADDLPSRVILFDATGRQSAARDIESIAGQTISWSTSNPLPTGYDVDRVRVEQWEPRYSYLLTVRKQTNPIPPSPIAAASVDVVVFFRRTLSDLDEQQYDAIYNPGQRTYTVTTAGGKPYWKRGGYLFDADNARWLRVQKVNEQSGTVSIEGNPIITDVQTHVMFPRGVVEVYPIGNK